MDTKNWTDDAFDEWLEDTIPLLDAFPDGGHPSDAHRLAYTLCLLEQPEASRVRDHLSACSGCRRLVREMAIVRGLELLGQATAGVKQRIADVVLDATRGWGKYFESAPSVAAGSNKATLPFQGTEPSTAGVKVLIQAIGADALKVTVERAGEPVEGVNVVLRHQAPDDVDDYLAVAQTDGAGEAILLWSEPKTRSEASPYGIVVLGE